MKVRSGFVSNSSSSSFLLIGIVPTVAQRKAFSKEHGDRTGSSWEGDLCDYNNDVNHPRDLIALKLHGMEHNLNAFTIDQLEEAKAKVEAEFGKNVKVLFFHGEEYN